MGREPNATVGASERLLRPQAYTICTALRWLTQNSAGIHDAQRVKCCFDGAHGSEFGRVAEAFKVGHF